MFSVALRLLIRSTYVHYGEPFAKCLRQQVQRLIIVACVSCQGNQARQAAALLLLYGSREKMKTSIPFYFYFGIPQAKH